jgi:exodeoxyribonuclease VII large subunit
LEREKLKLVTQSEKLKSLNPLAVLERGFSVAFTADGRAVKSVDELPEGTEFNLRLSDGNISAVAKG